MSKLNDIAKEVYEGKKPILDALKEMYFMKKDLKKGEKPGMNTKFYKLFDAVEDKYKEFLVDTGAPYTMYEPGKGETWTDWGKQSDTEKITRPFTEEEKSFYYWRLEQKKND